MTCASLYSGPEPIGEACADLDQLTPREREVLRHIARGDAYEEIGRQLDISTKTVESHVRRSSASSSSRTATS